MTSIDVGAYLARINYSGPTDPSLDTLRRLQRAHLLSVPFENLDIHLGRRIVLEVDWLFDKIVNRRRGGFCYELNGLFAELLLALGFDVDRLAARVWSDGAYGIELAHMTLLVRLDSPCLADVGFGEAFREPLRLAEGVEQRQRFGKYRLVREGDLWRYDTQPDTGPWQAQYLFPLTPRTLEDFQPGCDYQQTSPESHFTQKRVCTLATSDGRVTLRDTRLILTRGDLKGEIPVDGEIAFRTALREHFGIDLASQIT